MGIISAPKFGNQMELQKAGDKVKLNNKIMNVFRFGQ